MKSRVVIAPSMALTKGIEVVGPRWRPPADGGIAPVNAVTFVGIHLTTRRLTSCGAGSSGTGSFFDVRRASAQRWLKGHGRSLDGISDDSFASDQPVLASCYRASAADVQLLGPAAGRKTAKLVRPLRLVQGTGTTALAEVGGVNLHAAVAVDGRALLACASSACVYCLSPRLPFSRVRHPHAIHGHGCCAASSPSTS